MKLVVFVLLLLASEYEGYTFRYLQQRRRGPSPSGKYRISPRTGVKIALPSKFVSIGRRRRRYRLLIAPEQLRWQAQELGMLIHFNIATYIDGDGCEGQTVPNITLFNPYLLNTDNWVRTMLDFGAQYAVLVGKVTRVLFSPVESLLFNWSS